MIVPDASRFQVDCTQSCVALPEDSETAVSVSELVGGVVQHIEDLFSMVTKFVHDELN